MATGVLHDGEGLTDACIRYLNKGEKKKNLNKRKMKKALKPVPGGLMMF